MESLAFLDRLTAFLPALPPGLLEAWGQVALFAVPVCLYFAAAMLPFVVLYGLIRAHFGRRSLLERCSRQQARFGNFLNWLFVVCALALWGTRAVSYEEWPLLYRLALYAGAGLLLAGTILWTFVVTAWKPLRKWPVVHGFLVFLTGICLAALPVLALIAGRLVLQSAALPQELDPVVLLDLLTPSLGDPFWAYFGLIHCLEIAAAGALGLFWLLVRRNADDFGRDYYVFAANWCGGWAAWGGWLSLLLASILCAMLRWQGLLPFENRTVLLFVVMQFAALFLAALLWTLIARSALPMRRKIGMVVALLLLIVAVANSGLLVLL